MISAEIQILAGTAASIGIVHTVLGPDHYLPFIFMSKARKWSILKTVWVTLFCGLGHVGSSILLGTIGYSFGIAVSKLELFEGFRGNLAAYAFVVFGFLYFLWGLNRAIRKKPHKHVHLHNDGSIHTHEHNHQDDHDHIHKRNITPWILFTIFVLGPCEPLIPILMYPAAESSGAGMLLIASIFGIATIATMVCVVIIGIFGFQQIKLGRIERYTHALAGAIISLSGLGIVFLDL